MTQGRKVCAAADKTGAEKAVSLCSTIEECKAVMNLGAPATMLRSISSPSVACIRRDQASRG